MCESNIPRRQNRDEQQPRMMSRVVLHSSEGRRMDEELDDFPNTKRADEYFICSCSFSNEYHLQYEIAKQQNNQRSPQSRS